MQPAFIYTDASFSKGHNTPSEWVCSLAKYGYDCAAIIDQDSAGALIQAKKAAKKEGLSVLCGVTLTVSHPERDSLLWFHRFEKQLKSMYDTLRLEIPKPTVIFEKTQIIRSVISRYATKNHPKKIKLSDVPGLICDAFPEAKSENMDAESIKAALGILKTINDKPVHGSLICIAQSESDYKTLLKLASQRALHKHYNIHNPDKTPKSYAAHLDDVIRAADTSSSFIIVDPLTSESVFGGMIESDLYENNQNLLDELACRITFGVHNYSYKNKREHIFHLKRPTIPLPTFRFVHKDEYEEYQVKIAVHLKGRDIDASGKGENSKAIIFDHGFPNPDRESHLKTPNDWKSSLLFNENDFDEINWTYWESKKETSITLGQVYLPNYAMSIKDVVEYAARLKEKEHPLFDGHSSAKMWFCEWMKSECPEGNDLDAFVTRRLNDFCLHQISADGLETRLSELSERNDEIDKNYHDRFDMEFKVIEGMGFSGYFLIVFDVVSYARKIGVPVGDGRGSAAGSLIVYSLGITDVDPIEYDLQFERFLNPERVSMPDIDVDFGDGIGVNRNTVLQYVSEKYQQAGTEHPSSSQIANVNKYQLKAALSAVRSSLGLSMRYDGYLKMIVKQVEMSLGLKATESVTWDVFLSQDTIRNKLKKEPVFAKVVRFAKNLSGKRSTYGVHAGGVVISPTIITDFSAVECDDRGKFFTEFDKDDIEQAGLIKLDFLGLRTLAIVEETVKLAFQTKKEKINHRRLPKDEPDVMTLICQQKLADIFQLESPGMRDLVGRLQPQNIGEVGVLSALFRPGALDSGMVEDFVNVKFGKQAANYEHPALQKVTQDTYGCIVYQEQVMSIVRELAGYSLGEADVLRRAMGKKKIEEMQMQKSIYNFRAQQHWREHYLEIGKKQGLDFALDVNLEDFRPAFEALGFPDALNKEGYLAKWENVIPFLGFLMDWTEQDQSTFTQRINDMNYVVRLFKEHYQAAFQSKIPEKIKDTELVNSEEATLRIYYAVSQMVRFNQIFNKVEKFAGYGFNKSHAIAYSIITYKAAFLKCRYPAEFYSAALTYKDLDVLHDTVTEAKSAFNIQLLTPHINLSEENFYPEDDRNIRYGFGKLRDMGKFAPFIVREREEQGQFTSLYDFLVRMEVSGKTPNISVMKSLSYTGAFDIFIPTNIRRSHLNGRQFIFWLREMLANSPFNTVDKGRSALHQQLSLLSEFELDVYYLTLAKPAWLKKNNFPETLQFMVEGAGKSKSSPSNSLFDVEDKPECSHSVSVLLDKEPMSKSLFETTYSTLFMRFYSSSTQDELRNFWSSILEKACAQPIIDTLNQERHYSGMYITSNPLKVLKVADLASREPPGTYMNGYPTKIADIDHSFSDRRVSTFGIVRDVALKTVKKEDSAYYGEKLLIFKIEDGANMISCMIFGTRATKQFAEKIITDGVVLLLGGEVSSNDFGLTISVEAVKRYFPTADDMLHVVPKMSKRK